MSLYPGKPTKKADDTYQFDYDAMNQSMAEAIEKEMNELFSQIKGYPLSEMGKDDRRILFMAIARGILGYLDEWQQQFITTITIDNTPYPDYSMKVKEVDLNINMDKKE